MYLLLGFHSHKVMQNSSDHGENRKWNPRFIARPNNAGPRESGLFFPLCIHLLCNFGQVTLTCHLSVFTLTFIFSLIYLEDLMYLVSLHFPHTENS